MSNYPGLFNNHQPLTGRDWLRNLPADDRKAFSAIGFENSGYGITGGIIRAETAKRCPHGHFIGHNHNGACTACQSQIEGEKQWIEIL